MKFFNSYSTPSLKENFSDYQKWIDHYTSQMWVSIRLDSKLPAPWAFLPESWDIVLNRTLLQKKLKCSFEQILITIFHEIEHLREYVPLTYKQKDEYLEYADREWRSYALYDNLIRDIFVNKEVQKNIPALAPEFRPFYKEKLFPSSYYKKSFLTLGRWVPKQFQFCYALLRETFVPDEICSIDEEARKYVTQVHNNWLFHKATHGTLQQRLGTVNKHFSSLNMQELKI
jgi:hypothetical protein